MAFFDLLSSRGSITQGSVAIGQGEMCYQRMDVTCANGGASAAGAADKSVFSFAGRTEIDTDDDNKKVINVIAMHGWLDNSATFLPLIHQIERRAQGSAAGSFHEREWHIYAVDFAGHGHSFHRPVGCRYSVWDYALDIAEMIEQLSLTNVVLVGHSMGACLAPLTATVLPEQVIGIFAIEGLGPITTKPHDTAKQLQQSWQKTQEQTRRQPRIMESREVAIQVRMHGVHKLDRESATMIVERNLTAGDDGFMWRTDRRVSLPSPVRFTEEQVTAVLQALAVPVCLVVGAGMRDNMAIKERAAQIKQLRWLELEGAHHLHMREQVVATGDALIEFVTALIESGRD